MEPESEEKDEGSILGSLDKFNLFSFSTISIGLILMIIGLIEEGSFGFHLIFALGISIVTGMSFGYVAYLYLNSPQGILLGFVVGLFLPPLISSLIRGPEPSYFAAILGPAVGALIGGVIDKIGDDKEKMELDKLSKYKLDSYRQEDQFQKE